MLKFLICYPLSLIYGFVISTRNLLFDIGVLKQTETRLPTLVVGNLSTGGTGKTPMIQWLLSQLSDLHPAVLSRGYGRSTKGLRMVDTKDDAILCGDEPLEIKQAFPEVPVVVCENRLSGIAFIEKQFPACRLVLLDDGFQHRQLKPGLAWVLMDYQSLLKPLQLLPLGRLREPLSALKRAHYVIITKCPDGYDMNLSREKISPCHIPIVHSKMAYGNTLVHACNKDDSITSESLKNRLVYCISGIANPDALLQYLEKISGKLYPLTYPDHHAYNKKDEAEFLQLHKNEAAQHVFVCTQKDAVKLKKFMEQNPVFPLYILRASVEFAQQNDTFALIKNIRDYVGKYTRDGQFS
ncbi:MAG: tetraacyldisaccharide 4'-kinase [Bacteroidota bacterium]